MKVITNNEYYVQKGDLEFLLYNDSNFPINLFSHCMGFGNNDEFVKIINEDEKTYLEESKIPSFNKLYMKSMQELEAEIKRLRHEMEENVKSEDVNHTSRADELIKRFKSQRRKAYYLSQYSEMLMYKKGLSTMTYPDAPNPCIKPISDGIVAACPSLQRNKIVFYSLDGTMISEEEINLIYEIAIEDFKDTLKYPREDDEIEVIKRISEDGKYLTYAVEVRHCDTKLKPFMRLFKRK